MERRQKVRGDTSRMQSLSPLARTALPRRQDVRAQTHEVTLAPQGEGRTRSRFRSCAHRAKSMPLLRRVSRKHSVNTGTT